VDAGIRRRAAAWGGRTTLPLSGVRVLALAPHWRCNGFTAVLTAIGIGFAVLGVVCSLYSFWRHREVEEAVSRGEFAHPDERLISLLSGVGAALGILLVVVLLTES
jgi:uncharacterized membrane protein YidH (DUF202 family)